MPKPIPRAASFLWVTAAYVAGLAAAWAAARAAASLHPMWIVAIADAAATIAVFVFSVAFDNTSVYDPYWSVAPMVIAPYLAARPEAAQVPFARVALVCGLVTLWGARLTYNWARSFQGLGHEDWRYVDIRRKTRRAYWVSSFFGLHFFPTVLVYLGCLPLFPALTKDRPLGLLDALGGAVTLGAIVIEAVADEQLRRFRRSRRSPTEIMRTGLWAFSRHPNYFGEVLFWWGLFLLGFAADGGAAWTIVGALGILALFHFVSIPLLDRRSMAGRPEYAEHIRRVSALIPWFPKRGDGLR